ncbi:MAG: 50S ribosomal protein L17 [Clostridiales bacterium]|nr:50S ribosomal protein L17 [Clostridiales bacterium]
MNKKLGKSTDQRLALLYNQASALLWNGQIETTYDRAKSVKRIAEKIITLAIKTYQDTVEVTKTKLNQKNEPIEVKFTNDGPKKLAARRRIMAKLHNLQEVKEPKESKESFRERTRDVKHPLVEKIFREYAPKYDKRAQDLGQGGGYTRIIKIDNRRGDNAQMVILQLV